MGRRDDAGGMVSGPAMRASGEGLPPARGGTAWFTGCFAWHRPAASRPTVWRHPRVSSPEFAQCAVRIPRPDRPAAWVRQPPRWRSHRDARGSRGACPARGRYRYRHQPPAVPARAGGCNARPDRQSPRCAGDTRRPLPAVRHAARSICPGRPGAAARSPAGISKRVAGRGMDVRRTWCDAVQLPAGVRRPARERLPGDKHVVGDRFESGPGASTDFRLADGRSPPY